MTPFYIGAGILICLSIYYWIEIKRFFDKKETLPLRVALGISTLDTTHFALVVLSSLYHSWLLPFDRIASLLAGSTMTAVGLAVMMTGMFELRSMRRIFGMEISMVITTGIYKWSRNPQYVGWFMCLLGISLIGRSGLAFLFSAVLIIGIHLFVVLLEEPYLESVLGDEYRLYKLKTPRYIGIPGSKSSANS